MKYQQKVVVPRLIQIKALNQIKSPHNVKDVRSVLGFVGFYWKFIQTFAEISLPLVRLTKKNVKFEWSIECQNSFEDLTLN